MVSKHVEQRRCPFLIQNVLVDLSMSLRQIKHLNIGVITKSLQMKPLISF